MVLIFPLSQLQLHVAHLRLLFGVAQPNHPREKKQTSSEEAFSSFFFFPSFLPLLPLSALFSVVAGRGWR